jgi:Exostosin family
MSVGESSSSSRRTAVLRIIGSFTILVSVGVLWNENVVLPYYSNWFRTTNKEAVVVDGDVATHVEKYGSRNHVETSDPSFSSSALPEPSTTRRSDPTFFLVAPPEYTSDVVASSNDTEQASRYYRTNLNEESAEAWLYRGFAKHKRRIQEPQNATFVLVAGYLHLKWGMLSQGHNQESEAYKSNLSETYTQHLTELYAIDPDIKNRPHLLLIPTWNPSVSEKIGVQMLVKTVMNEALEVPNVWSVGFERNPAWQAVSVERIVPIPYVVGLENNSESSSSLLHTDELPGSPPQATERQSNFVFYSGDARPYAKVWAGCHRKLLIGALQNETNITNVRIITGPRDQDPTSATTDPPLKRLSQTEYNRLMHTSDYCFIICGDTPTSRSLSSAMVAGCIPIFVGSRWRGLCEPPCIEGWGWTKSGSDYPHLPYRDIIPWENFPELDEQRFMDHGRDELFNLFGQFNDARKKELRSTMHSTRKGWIYGWGDPLTSDQFGDAVEYIWESFLTSL